MADKKRSAFFFLDLFLFSQPLLNMEFGPSEYFIRKRALFVSHLPSWCCIFSYFCHIINIFTDLISSLAVDQNKVIFMSFFLGF